MKECWIVSYIPLPSPDLSGPSVTTYLIYILIIYANHGDPWRNGSASDSRSEGCVFDVRRVQNPECILQSLNFLFLWPLGREVGSLKLKRIQERRPKYLFLSQKTKCSDAKTISTDAFSSHHYQYSQNFL